MRAVPAVGAVNPRRIFTVVVLPAPFGPSRPKSSPGRTAMSIPSSAVMIRRPSEERYSLRRPLTSTTASFMTRVVRGIAVAGCAVMIAGSSDVRQRSVLRPDPPAVVVDQANRHDRGPGLRRGRQLDPHQPGGKDPPAPDRGDHRTAAAPDPAEHPFP